MERYEAVLSQREIDVLSNAVGIEFAFVYSRALHYDTFHKYLVTFNSYSIGRKGSFIIIKNEWLETETELDYWKLSVEHDSHEYGEYEGEPIISSSCSFYGIDGYPTIMSIDIYTVTKSYDDEQVIFDKAIVFNTSDGQAYCVSAMTSIADGVELTWDSKRMAEVLNGTTLRRHISR